MRIDQAYFGRKHGAELTAYAVKIHGANANWKRLNSVIGTLKKHMDAPASDGLAQLTRPGASDMFLAIYEEGGPRPLCPSVHRSY